MFLLVIQNIAHNYMFTQVLFALLILLQIMRQSRQWTGSPSMQKSVCPALNFLDMCLKLSLLTLKTSLKYLDNYSNTLETPTKKPLHNCRIAQRTPWLRTDEHMYVDTE